MLIARRARHSLAIHSRVAGNVVEVSRKNGASEGRKRTPGGTKIEPLGLRNRAKIALGAPRSAQERANCVAGRRTDTRCEAKAQRVDPSWGSLTGNNRQAETTYSIESSILIY